MARACVEPIVAVDLVDACVAVHGVVAVAAEHNVVAVAAAHAVVVRTGEDKVAARVTANHVVAGPAKQPIAVVAAGDRVGTVVSRAGRQGQPGGAGEHRRHDRRRNVTGRVRQLCRGKIGRGYQSGQQRFPRDRFTVAPDYVLSRQATEHVVTHAADRARRHHRRL